MTNGNENVTDGLEWMAMLCPHCDKELTKIMNVLYFKWVCKDHGDIYGSNMTTIFELEASKKLREDNK